MGCSESTSISSAIAFQISIQTVEQVKSLLRQQISTKSIYQIDFDITKLLEILSLNQKTQISQDYLKKILQIVMDYISFCKNKMNKDQNLPIIFARYAEEKKITYKEGIVQLCEKIKKQVLLKKQKLKMPKQKLAKLVDQNSFIAKPLKPLNALDILQKEFKKKHQKEQKVFNKANILGISKNEQIVDQMDKMTDNQKLRKYQSKKQQRQKQNIADEECIKPISGFYLAPLNPFAHPISLKRQMKDKKDNQQSQFNWEDTNLNSIPPKMQEKQKLKIAGIKHAYKSPINFQKAIPKYEQKGLIQQANTEEIIENTGCQQEIQQVNHKISKNNSIKQKRQSIGQYIYRPQNNIHSRLVHHYQITDQEKIIPPKSYFCEEQKQKNDEYQFNFDEKSPQTKQQPTLQIKNQQIIRNTLQSNQKQQDEYSESFQNYNGNTQKTLGLDVGNQQDSNSRKDIKNKIQKNGHRASKKKETTQIVNIKKKDLIKISKMTKNDQINLQESKKLIVMPSRQSQWESKINQAQNSLPKISKHLQLKAQPKQESILPKIPYQKQITPYKNDNLRKNINQKVPMREQNKLDQKVYVINSKRDINKQKDIQKNNSNSNINIKVKVQVDDNKIEKKFITNLIKKEQKQVTSKPNILLKKVQNKPKVFRKQIKTVIDNKNKSINTIVKQKQSLPVTKQIIQKCEEDPVKEKQNYNQTIKEKVGKNIQIESKVKQQNLISSSKNNIHDISIANQVVKRQEPIQQPKEKYKKSQFVQSSPDLIDDLLNSKNDALDLDQKLKILAQEMKSNKIYHKNFDIKILLDVINLYQYTYVPDSNKKQIIFIALDYASFCKNNSNGSQNLPIQLKSYAQNKNISYVQAITQLCEKIQGDIDQINECDF